jgi:hypothetical protein
MKYILFVVLTGRNVFPRLPDFQFHEALGLWVYQGKAMDADEFNAACERVFHPTYRNKDYVIRPKVVGDLPEPEPAPEPVEEPAAFTLVDNDIMLDGERVGGIHPPGPHLRVARGRQDLRPALEAWFATQTFPEA